MIGGTRWPCSTAGRCPSRGARQRGGAATRDARSDSHFPYAVAVEHGASGQKRARLVPCDVQFRAFPEEAIEPYLRADRPYDCAGSAKIDSLGIALVERLDGDDPDGARRPAADSARRDARRARARRPAAGVSAGTLYLVPTPLAADAADASVPVPVRGRIRRIGYFIVEEPKSARAFLKALEHPRPLASLAIERLPAKSDETLLDGLLGPLLAGQDAGLAVGGGSCPQSPIPVPRSSGGRTTIGVRVVPLVGPSAILLALMASGLEGQRFAFHGYLPGGRSGARAAAEGARSRLPPRAPDRDFHRDAVPQRRAAAADRRQLRAGDAALGRRRPHRCQPKRSRLARSRPGGADRGRSASARRCSCSKPREKADAAGSAFPGFGEREGNRREAKGPAALPRPLAS